ncbi:MAG: hypothetical protein JWM57_1885 [Phycisphaerales bacterium]|nr:hypothetical protein [Phycisphaerales bacterium]
MAIGGTVISLVLGDRSAVLAQVSTEKSGRTVQRVGRFDAPAGTRLLDKPADTGASLAAFLAGHGFSAKKAVVGVPARWVIAQEKDLPPVDVGGAADLLRLAAERLSLAEAGSLVADYAGAPDPKNASRVLLVGMLKPQLDKVTQFIEAAGLSLEAVCPTALAIARVAGGDRSVLRLSDDGAELVVQQNGNPRTLQPLTPDMAALGSELRRNLTMRGAAADVLLADGIGLSTAQHADLAGRLSRPPQAFGDDLGISVDSSARNGSVLSSHAHWPAVALAVAAADKRGLPVDFNDTKLLYRPPARFGQRTILAAAAGVLVVAGFIWLITTVSAQEARERELFQQVKDQEPIAKDARAVIDQLTYGRTYFDHRPPALECVRQATLAFNYDEPIWATKIVYNINGHDQLVGKVLDDRGDTRLILDLAARLSANPSFTNVSVPTQSEGGSKEKLKTFSINFSFEPKAPPAKADEAKTLPAKAAK